MRLTTTFIQPRQNQSIERKQYDEKLQGGIYSKYDRVV